MSYTTPPSGYLVPEQPGGSPARPGTVSFATFLLYLMALLSVVSAALAIYQATFMTKDKMVTILRDGGYPADQAEAAATFTPAVIYGTAGVTVLVAIAYLILAIFVGKGKQWARITSWVVVGLFGICCGLAGVAGSAAGGAFSGMGAGTGDIDQEKITKDTAALIPEWLTPVSTVLGIISLCAAIAIVVLLLLPPSNPYFRKQEPVWTPPTYPQAP